MKRIAEFSKVSFDTFKNSCLKIYTDITIDKIKEYYDDIQLPKRATKGSAGYDFFMPYNEKLNEGETRLIPTGIRVKMVEGWVLKIYPRSGLGFKYRIQLDNTVGIIDSDYYYSDNEGHIIIKITCDANEKKVATLNKGTAVVQGIFVEYGITIDDNTTDVRNGGFGSTTN